MGIRLVADAPVLFGTYIRFCSALLRVALCHNSAIIPSGATVALRKTSAPPSFALLRPCGCALRVCWLRCGGGLLCRLSVSLFHLGVLSCLFHLCWFVRSVVGGLRFRGSRRWCRGCVVPARVGRRRLLRPGRLRFRGCRCLRCWWCLRFRWSRGRFRRGGFVGVGAWRCVRWWCWWSRGCCVGWVGGRCPGRGPGRGFIRGLWCADRRATSSRSAAPPALAM